MRVWLERVVIMSFLGVVGSTATPARAQYSDLASVENVVSDSQSIGYSDEGSLVHAIAIQSSDRLAVVRSNPWGTRELVGLLNRAADSVAREAPGSRLAVGDLSTRSGGYFPPHGSHQNGRDADVGFFVLDEDGHSVPKAVFLEIGPDGTGRRGATRYTFDDARNWALLAAFVDDPMAEVQHVLIAAHLRQRLFDYASRSAAPADEVRRIELVTNPIRGSERHDDHFHVRIYCSIGDRPQCVDRPPFHPWYDGTPTPRSVEVARLADLQRALALSRGQALEQQAVLSLEEVRAQQQMFEDWRAHELAMEPARQAADERRRAAALSQQERRLIIENRERERELEREQAQIASQERGRAASLVAEERRWFLSERARATRLRASARTLERAAGAALREQERRQSAVLREAASQRTADQRRATELLRRGETLRRGLRARPH